VPCVGITVGIRKKGEVLHLFSLSLFLSLSLSLSLSLIISYVVCALKSPAKSSEKKSRAKGVKKVGKGSENILLSENLFSIILRGTFWTTTHGSHAKDKDMLI
jgi:hypothetical protein